MSAERADREAERARLRDGLRASRGFDAAEVEAAKLGRLARWFAAHELDAAVVGVSGGVDSALVLALLQRALRRDGSPLRRVIALMLPIAGRGTTNQADATARGRRVADALGAEAWEVPLGDAVATTMTGLAHASGLAPDAWAEGQCASVVRTPALYGAVALLRAHGWRAVVAGTTNRDEGAYLGFFGKASDGMVDVQLISDLHKSEVRALARRLGVPDDIVDATPRGDVHDGRTDEQMIGATYDDVELAVRARELGRDASALIDGAARAAIERQHAVNAHKYAVGSPAVHLDVLTRGCAGGWADGPLAPRGERRPPADALPGSWTPPPLELAAPGDAWPTWRRVPLAHAPRARVIRVGGALTARDCDALASAFDGARAIAEPVDVTGIRGAAAGGYGAGSTRATAWSPELAAQLFARLRPALPATRFVDSRDYTDAFATATRAGHRTWRLVGVSPLLRFMRYAPGGRHLVHYDAGFDYGDGRRTLMSIVWFVTDAPGSGATRVVRDGQDALPAGAREFADWARDTRDDEVALAVHPARGAALVFDHRLPHDVQRWDGPGERVIIRGDVVYEAVDDGRGC
jgi:NAD+ synthetase|nr:NAD(+) synthase [Kofleriaceae bacterium]